MKVRVKEGKIGFIYGKLRKGDIPGRKPEQFTLVAFEHPRKKDGKGEPLVISAEDQFSKVWMEKIESAKEVKADKPEKAKEDKPEKQVKKTAKK